MQKFYFNLVNRIINNGGYDKDHIEQVVNVYFARDLLTFEQYEELMDKLNA